MCGRRVGNHIRLPRLWAKDRWGKPVPPLSLYWSGWEGKIMSREEFRGNKARHSQRRIARESGKAAGKKSRHGLSGVPCAYENFHTPSSCDDI